MVGPVGENHRAAIDLVDIVDQQIIVLAAEGVISRLSVDPVVSCIAGGVIVAAAATDHVIPVAALQ